MLDSANLSLAWKQVKAKKGAPDIEGKQGVPELKEIWIRLHAGVNSNPHGKRGVP